MSPFGDETVVQLSRDVGFLTKGTHGRVNRQLCDGDALEVVFDTTVECDGHVITRPAYVSLPVEFFMAAA